MTLRGRTLLTAGAVSTALMLCGFTAEQSKSAVSPDGRWRAVIENAGTDADPDSGPASVLRIEPVAGGGPGRVVVRGQAQAPQDVKRAFHSFERPLWSLDGGYVYVSASAYATSPAVHQVDVKTGAEHFVIDGEAVSVIRSGPYRGMLLVSRHKYHPAPKFGSYDPVDVLRPDGEVMLTVPGSAEDEGDHSVERWLAAHGWTAN